MEEIDLDAALKQVAVALAASRVPSRLEARTVLVAIGSEILAGRDAVAEPALARVREWISAAPVEWRAAIASEIEMAATEHVRAVDPRWLSHPRYDLAYTLAARERLEARLVAAEGLGVDVQESVLQAIERADGLLAPLLGDSGALPPG